MKFENVYFINGTAYAGKSTIVKELADPDTAVFAVKVTDLCCKKKA